MKLLLGINLLLIVVVSTFLLLREDRRAPDQTLIPRTERISESPEGKAMLPRADPSQRVSVHREVPQKPDAALASTPSTPEGDAGLRIEGIVLSPDGKPMPSWLVSLWQDDKVIARTNSAMDGRFRFQVADEGGFELRGSDNMEALRTRVLVFPRMRVKAGDRGVRVRIEPGEGGTVRALLTSSGKTGIPDRVQVHLLNQDKARGGLFRIVPCREGSITIKGIPEGDYTIEFFVPDLMAEPLPVLTVRRKSALDLGRIYFHPQGAIAGRIFDSRGKALAGIGVYLDHPYGRWLNPSNDDFLATNQPTTRTDSAGRFHLTGYRDPWTQIVFTAKGYAPLELHLQSADQARTLWLRLEKPATLRLEGLPRSIEYEGKAVPITSCELVALRLPRSYSGWKEHPLFNHSLSFGLAPKDRPILIPDLPPGRYRVSVGRNDKFGDHRDIELIAGKSVTLSWK